jgi:hypothetical protein
MAKTKRTPTKREYDLRLITDLYLAGKSQAEIAKELDLSQPQISYDLAQIRAAWQAQTTFNLDEAKQIELARIDALERIYYAAWERSLAERTKTKTEQATGPAKRAKGPAQTRAKATVERETLPGNPAYLAGIMSCIERRCKILGLDAPTKIAPTNPAGDAPYIAADEMARARAKALAAEAELLSDDAGG